MRTTEEFIQIIMQDFLLNETQLKILGQVYPPIDNWELEILDQEITKEDAELLVILKGNFTLNIQKQLVQNYKLLH